jgi:hypothetical protein
MSAVSPTTASGTSARATAAYWLIAGALSLVLVASITSVDYLATSDGPQRIFAGQMLNHLHDPGRGYDKYLAESPTLTNVGFELVFARLEPQLGWRRAYQVVLCLIALLWAWGVCALAASLGRRWLGLVGFASALQWGFYMGLFSWQMGTALGFFVLAWAFWRGSERTLDRMMLAALFLCQAVVHSFAAMLTGFVLLVHALLSAEGKARGKAVAVLLALALPAIAVGLWTLLHHVGNQAAATYSYPPTSLGHRFVLLARGVVSGPGWRAWPLVLLAGWGLVACRRWKVLDARERALGLAGIVLVLGAVVLPLHTRGWEFFCVRFAPLGLVLLALLALRGSSRLVGLAAAAAVIVYATSSLAWSWQHHVRIRQASTDLLAGLDAPIRRQGLRLPLPLEPPPGEDADEWTRDIPYVATNSHLGALYAVAQGGVPSVLFAGLSGQVLRWRQPPESWMPPHPPRGYEWHLWEAPVRANPKRRWAGLIRYLSFAAPFEDVILQALPSDVQLLERLGFVVDFRQGGMMVARFRGCPLSVTVTAPADGPASIFLSVGWAGMAQPIYQTNYQTTIAPDAPARNISVPGSPCGWVWVRVLFDMDGDGEPSPGDRFCQGADAQATFYQDVKGDASQVVCQPGPPI